jgi:hypothetical protein
MQPMFDEAEQLDYLRKPPCAKPMPEFAALRSEVDA